MKSTRLYLGIALVAVASLGAFWAVSAQDRGPLFAPPVVVPTEKKYPHQTQPLRDKSKSADPSMIIPAEVYEVPRPVRGEPTDAKQGVLGVVQIEGESPAPLPLPMFPAPPPEPKVETGPSVVVPEPKPLPLPMPMLEPTKVLITEPVSKEPAPKKVVIPEAPKIEFPKPTVIPEPKLEPLAPPKISLPTTVAPPTVSVPAVAPPEPERSRAFVRIKPDVLVPPPPVVKPAPDTYLQDLQKRLAHEQPPTPPLASPGAGLANLQTPSITIEKRGLRMLRAMEPQAYQIVIRNLGPTSAQQVRIEDELPPNVKLVSADPMPVMQNGKATWFLPVVNANQEQTLRFTLQALKDTDLAGRLIAHVAAHADSTTTGYRPPNNGSAMTIGLSGPNQVAVGKQAVFEIRVTNASSQPLTGLVLYGNLPEGLVMRVNDGQGQREEREIKGDVDETILPGESKTLKMPATAIKPGRWNVSVKLTASGGAEASAATGVDVAGQTLHLQQAPATRLVMGRDGELRIELSNYTNKPMKNVAVANRLPDGLDFIAASERGLYQANTRTVYWLLDQLPAGKTQQLVVRVNGAKSGQHQNIVFARADGVPEIQSASTVALEGFADLNMRVVDRDPLIELGKENVYEIRVHNPGNAPASNVQLQVQFPPGLAPKSAQGNSKFSIDGPCVNFEPIATLEANGQAIYRVTAVAQAMGDQRVRFAVQSEQVRTPIQREISTRVVEK